MSTSPFPRSDSAPEPAPGSKRARDQAHQEQQPQQQQSRVLMLDISAPCGVADAWPCKLRVRVGVPNTPYNLSMLIIGCDNREVAEKRVMDDITEEQFSYVVQCLGLAARRGDRVQSMAVAELYASNAPLTIDVVSHAVRHAVEHCPQERHGEIAMRVARMLFYPGTFVHHMVVPSADVWRTATNALLQVDRSFRIAILRKLVSDAKTCSVGAFAVAAPRTKFHNAQPHAWMLKLVTLRLANMGCDGDLDAVRALGAMSRTSRPMVAMVLTQCVHVVNSRVHRGGTPSGKRCVGQCMPRPSGRLASMPLQRPLRSVGMLCGNAMFGPRPLAVAHPAEVGDGLFGVALGRLVDTLTMLAKSSYDENSDLWKTCSNAVFGKLRWIKDGASHDVVRVEAVRVTHPRTRQPASACGVNTVGWRISLSVRIKLRTPPHPDGQPRRVPHNMHTRCIEFWVCCRTGCIQSVAVDDDRAPKLLSRGRVTGLFDFVDPVLCVPYMLASAVWDTVLGATVRVRSYASLRNDSGFGGHYGDGKGACVSATELNNMAKRCLEWQSHDGAWWHNKCHINRSSFPKSNMPRTAGIFPCVHCQHAPAQEGGGVACASHADWRGMMISRH